MNHLFLFFLGLIFAFVIFAFTFVGLAFILFFLFGLSKETIEVHVGKRKGNALPALNNDKVFCH